MTTPTALRPFFYYFGGKSRAAKFYPEPRYLDIIEPFAGAAGYSLRYHYKYVTLYDVYPIICGLWDYLIRVSEEEILSLPLDVQHVDDLAICQEAKWLIGFWLNQATTTPRKSISAWRRNFTGRPFWGEATRKRIASQVNSIRHWKILNTSYENIPDTIGTWFIDAPYQGVAGKHYRNRIEDYAKLGEWCRKRSGQVIVCEKAGADWLPFRPFHTILTNPGPKGKTHSEEVIWTNNTGWHTVA